MRILSDCTAPFAVSLGLGNEFLLHTTPNRSKAAGTAPTLVNILLPLHHSTLQRRFDDLEQVSLLPRVCRSQCRGMVLHVSLLEVLPILFYIRRKLHRNRYSSGLPDSRFG